jgi:hypothetical protein
MSEVRLPGYRPQRHPPPWRRAEPARATRLSRLLHQRHIPFRTAPRSGSRAADLNHAVSARKEHASSVRPRHAGFTRQVERSDAVAPAARGIGDFVRAAVAKGRGGSMRPCRPLTGPAADDFFGARVSLISIRCGSRQCHAGKQREDPENTRDRPHRPFAPPWEDAAVPLRNNSRPGRHAAKRAQWHGGPCYRGRANEVTNVFF